MSSSAQTIQTPSPEPPNSIFTYQALTSPTSIRLVTLPRRSGDESLELSLEHAKLGMCSYEALSYEWKLQSDGDPVIKIDAQPVRIRRNLYDALQHIRLEHQDRCLWIDALCINQIDEDEKNRQVQMMGKIFAGAERVVSWLGLADDGSDQAMEMLRSLDSKTSWDVLLSELYRRTGSQRQLVEADRWLAEVKTIFRTLDDRSYWRRV